MQPQLGDFALKEMIAEGGMAVVYIAEQISLQRKVALKVLHGELSADSSLVKRFAREARSAASLTHPNIVQIYAVGCEGGVHYIAMEYVPGYTLHDYIRKKTRLELSEALDIIIRVSDALLCAAGANIVHRDIKPSNIMITPDRRVKVADFGLAKSYTNQEDDSGQLTRDGKIWGTVNYMSPEQGMGKSLDSRSDIYSLGVVFFEMLAGRPPFKGEHPTSVIYMHIHEAAPAVTFYNRLVPPDIESLIFLMMAKDPNDRPDDFRALLAELERIRESLHLDHRALAHSGQAPKVFDRTEMLPRQTYDQVARCLVVEDDPDIADLCVRVLTANGFSVIIAHDGVEALSLWRLRKPDLVLLDLHLPRLSGQAILEERNTVSLSGKVLVMSSDTEHNTIRHIAGLKVAGFLMKPLDPKILIKRALAAVNDLDH